MAHRPTIGGFSLARELALHSGMNIMLSNVFGDVRLLQQFMSQSTRNITTESRRCSLFGVEPRRTCHRYRLTRFSTHKFWIKSFSETDLLKAADNFILQTLQFNGHKTRRCPNIMRTCECSKFSLLELNCLRFSFPKTISNDLLAKLMPNAPDIYQNSIERAFVPFSHFITDLQTDTLLETIRDISRKFALDKAVRGKIQLLRTFILRHTSSHPIK